MVRLWPRIRGGWGDGAPRRQCGVRGAGNRAGELRGTLPKAFGGRAVHMENKGIIALSSKVIVCIRSEGQREKPGGIKKWEAREVGNKTGWGPRSDFGQFTWLAQCYALPLQFHFHKNMKANSVQCPGLDPRTVKGHLWKTCWNSHEVCSLVNSHCSNADFLVLTDAPCLQKVLTLEEAG